MEDRIHYEIFIHFNTLSGNHRLIPAHHSDNEILYADIVFRCLEKPTFSVSSDHSEPPLPNEDNLFLLISKYFCYAPFLHNQVRGPVFQALCRFMIASHYINNLAETGERVCLNICLPFTHSPVSETSPYRVNIFRIK
jgi:hypothetical protein